MKVIKMFLKCLSCVIFLIAPISTLADEVVTNPSASYVLTGGEQQIFSSLGEMISNINNANEARYAKCRATPSTLTGGYSCTKMIITGSSPSPVNPNTINGIPVNYFLPRIAESASKITSASPETIHQTSAGDLGASLRLSCPDTLSGRTTGQAPNQTFECLTIEPESCPADGNPINIGTGDKFEEETDFSTPDGLLKIQRFYMSQHRGWNFRPGYKLIFKNDFSDYVVISKRKRYSLEPESPMSLVEYTHVDPVSIISSSPEIMYLSDGRHRYRITSTNGVLKADGLMGKKTSIALASNTNPNAEGWIFSDVAGNKSYFSSSGNLLRTEYTDGRWLSYSYSGQQLLSQTDSFGRSLHYHYDDEFRLAAVTLPDGHQITYEYATLPFIANGQHSFFQLLSKITWPNGESISYSYNDIQNISGNNSYRMLTGKIDSYGNVVGSYKYINGKAVSTQGALGSFKRTMTHNSNHTQVTDGLNSTRTYYFNTVLSNGTKLVTSTNQPAGSGCAAATQSATYYADGLKKSETNFNGHKTQFAYDSARALETVRVEGIPSGNGTDYLPANTALPVGIRKITTQWHSQHRKPVKKSEPKVITTFIYNGDEDPFNNNAVANCSSLSLPLLCHKVQQATTDANGAAGISATLDNTLAARHEFYTYNDRGQQLTYSRTAADSPDETREYYAATDIDWTLGDLKKITNALGHVTEFTRYDRNGRLLEMTDANGIKTEFTYDARGRILTQSIDNKVTTYSYDLNGNRTGSVLPNGVAITYHYDLAKRLTEIESSLGDKMTYEYDVESNVRFERIKNATGDITYVKENVYDALSRLKNTLNTSNQGSTYLYDARGNLTGEVDANTYSTAFSFDALNRLKIITNPLNGKTEHGYDAQGNLTSVKDPKGNSTIYSYNAFGDLIGQISPDTGTTTHSYDALGNRTQSIDARGITVDYGYDDLNRLTSVEYAAMPSENITYVYDNTANDNYGIGRLTGIVRDDIHLDYVYNAQGLIFKKYTQVSNTFSSTEYHYDDAGNLTSVIYPSGRVINYHLDDLARITSITTQVNATANEQIIIENANYLPFGPANTYTYGNGLNHSQLYDQNYRLTDIQVGGLLNRTYGYDPVNNITSINDGLNSAKNQTIGYDQLNRLISSSGGYGNLGYTYDSVGNRLTETRNGVTDTYIYPTNSNRLNKIERSSGNRDFTYDSAGNPINRTAADNTTQTFNFNNANRLADVSVNNALAASYSYNPLGQRTVKTLANGTKEIYHYDEAGHLISVTDGTGATLREYIYWGDQQIALVNNGVVYYIHSDHLNTPQVVTDANQQVVWMGDYEPFGKLAANQTNTIELFSRFPGQYLDTETGLYYNYFRDYDPSVGRYIESDPIGLSGGINTYAYVNGNPIKYVDPTGEAAQAAGGMVGGLGILIPVGVGLGAVYCSFNPSHPSCQAAQDIIERCLDDKKTCPPCNPPVGTIRYRVDMVPPSEPHYPHTGSHVHLYKMNQNPNNCQCFWQPIGTTELPPPDGASPM